MKLVSVVVPVYNVEPYLEKCIRSVLTQTYANFELILVDDGSTDGSRAICDRTAERDARVRVIHRENGGLAAARNSGIALASGELITFIDSDDFVSSLLLERLVAALERTGAQVAICGHKAYQSEDFQEVPCAPTTPRVLGTAELLNTALIGSPFFVSAWAKLYDSRLFQTIRYPEGELYEDLSIVYELFSSVPVACYIDEPLYYYHKRAGSILRSGFSRKKLVYFDNAINGLAYVKRKLPACVSGAECKLLTASIDTLMMIGKTENEELRCVQSMCSRNIARYRSKWLFDRRLGKKYHLVMLLSWFHLEVFLARSGLLKRFY